MIYYTTGNLLTSDVDYICHQVNCQGKMNSGIAKSIREKWPEVYSEYLIWRDDNDLDILGQIDIVHTKDQKHIINMGGQEFYGYDNRRYTSYDAFWNCLEEIRNSVVKGSKLGFPDHIGSCRGGANWEVIRTMIEQALGQDYEVYIYKLEE